MSNMIESILVEKNNADCTSFHRFYVHDILQSKLPFFESYSKYPVLTRLTRLHEVSLSRLFSRETGNDACLVMMRAITIQWSRVL